MVMVAANLSFGPGCVQRRPRFGTDRKLSKKRSRGRIDGLTALAMAIGCAPLQAKTIDVSTLIA